MKLKRILALLLSLAMVFALLPLSVFAADGETISLPTATVEPVTPLAKNVPVYVIGDSGDPQATDKVVEQLGVEYVFTADEPSDETLAYYGSWNCDYVVSFDKAIAKDSFGLYGAYTGFGNDYNIAFEFPKNVAAGEEVCLLKEAGLAGVTYNDIATAVQKFTCGAFNLSDDNIGTTMTVKLMIWQDGDEDKTVIETVSYTFGEPTQLKPADLPEAIVTKIEPPKGNVPLYSVETLDTTGDTIENLAVQYQFECVTPSDETFAKYKSWYCDYVVSFDHPVVKDSLGLFGAYSATYNSDDYDFNVAFQFPSDAEIGDEFYLLSSAGLGTVTYKQIIDTIRVFNCGAFNLSEANIGTTMTVKLVIWAPDMDKEDAYTVETKDYTFEGTTRIIPGNVDLPEAEVTNITPPASNVQLSAINNGAIEPVEGKTVAALETEYLFTAVEPSDETLAYYGSWNCDYIVSFDKAIAAESIGLYGAYNGYGNEYKVAFKLPTAISAGQEIFLLEGAGLSGVTYNDIATVVKTFDCGAFNLSDNNIGTTMTVKLVIWKDGDEDKTVIETVSYTFEGKTSIVPPDLPEATITEITPETDVQLYAFVDGALVEVEGKTVAALEAEYKFTAVEPSDETLAYYGGWNCDYIVSFDKAVAAESIGLYGAYNGYGNEYKVAFKLPTAISAGQEIFLLESAGLSGVTYNDIATVVKAFDCGAFNLSEANIGTTMTVKLVIWKDGDEEKTLIRAVDYTFGSKTHILPPDPPKAFVEKVEPVSDVPLYILTEVTDIGDQGTPMPVDTGNVVTVNNVWKFSIDPDESQETFDYYKDWLCDFRVTFNKDIPANTFGLYGRYGNYNVAFVFPNDIHAGDSFYLLDLLDLGSWTYEGVRSLVREFRCGAFNLSEVNQNQGKIMDVYLEVWAPNDEDSKYEAAHEQYLFDDLTQVEITVLTEAKDTSGNVVGGATLSGGGDYHFGDEVTVTAPAAAGYKFVGWFDGDTQVSAEASYTFTAQQDITLTATYEAIGTANLTVIATKFTITIDGVTEEKQGTQNFLVPIGTEVKLEYTDDGFMYWVNSSDNIVSRSDSYTFTMIGTTTIYAVSEGDVQTDPTAYVVFYNAYDQIITNARVMDAGEIFDIFPSINPSKMGGEFDKWVIKDTDEVVTPEDGFSAITSRLSAEENVIIHVVPVYIMTGQPYTVQLDLKMDDVYPVTPPDPDLLKALPGEPIVITKMKIEMWTNGLYTSDMPSYWSLDGGQTAISFTDKYTALSAGDDIHLTLVVGEVTPEPAIDITQMTASLNGEKFRISTTMKYFVPDGYSVKASGFIYSSVTSSAEDLTLEGSDADPTVVKKHLTKFTDPSAIYTMNINTADASKTFHLVAFVSFTDGNGELITKYTAVRSGSYYSLSQGN